MIARAGDVRDEATPELAELVAAQTRERIDEEKAAPSGAPWAPVSTRYAARNPGRSLLEKTGALLASIRVQQITEAGFVVGSDLPYANRQNFRRPFLGLSAENEAEIDRTLESVIQRVLS